MVIAVTGSSSEEADLYAQAIDRHGGQSRLITPELGSDIESIMNGVTGLLLSGGADIHPSSYGQQIDPGAGVETDLPRDYLEFAALEFALNRDMPVLGICRGMQLLNVSFGGSLIQDIPGHIAGEDGSSQVHFAYVSPGSKLAAVLGGGAIYRVNSRHHQGLKDPQRATSLLASAYMPEDGIVEALESPAHSWVIAVQCHPERSKEVPTNFQNLFKGLIDWASRFKQ